MPPLKNGLANWQHCGAGPRPAGRLPPLFSSESLRAGGQGNTHVTVGRTPPGGTLWVRRRPVGLLAARGIGFNGGSGPGEPARGPQRGHPTTEGGVFKGACAANCYTASLPCHGIVRPRDLLNPLHPSAGGFQLLEVCGGFERPSARSRYWLMGIPSARVLPWIPMSWF
jgi:hypothetical protein